MKNHIFLFAALFSFVLGNVQAQDKTAKHELTVNTEQSRIETLLNSKNFEFLATSVKPRTGSSKNLVSNQYSIAFSPKNIYSHLPFYGRVYSGLNMGLHKGGHIEGEPEMFTVETNAKGYEVLAKVKDENDTFSISMIVSNSGYATLTISSNNRETISYMGEVVSAQ